MDVCTSPRKMPAKFSHSFRYIFFLYINEIFPESLKKEKNFSKIISYNNE